MSESKRVLLASLWAFLPATGAGMSTDVILGSTGTSLAIAFAVCTVVYCAVVIYLLRRPGREERP
jgi:hypothetical protein